MGILVNVLIVLSLVVLIISSLFESTVLQIKMVDRFKQHSIEWIEAQKRLTKLEKEIEKTGECKKPQCVLIEFVPDELFEAELSGVSYYAVRDKNQSTFAVRKQKLDGIVFHSSHLAWVDSSILPSGTVIGSDPEHQGVRLYVASNTLSVFQWVQNEAPRLVYCIDEKTIFGVPRLWHEMILIEKIPEKKLVIYQALTGKKLQELSLKQEPLSQDYPLCGTRPVVLVREAREQKRKIIVTHDKARWFVETELDFDLLGRRTEMGLNAGTGTGA